MAELIKVSNSISTMNIVENFGTESQTVQSFAVFIRQNLNLLFFESLYSVQAYQIRPQCARNLVCIILNLIIFSLFLQKIICI